MDKYNQIAICLDHININTKLPDETVDFYSQVLGFINSPELRPGGSIPGTWMFISGKSVLHINFVDNLKDKSFAESTGCIDHIAFTAKNSLNIKKTLEEFQIPYKLIETKDRHLTQFFFYDPNGIKIELNVHES